MGIFSSKTREDPALLKLLSTLWEYFVFLHKYDQKILKTLLLMLSAQGMGEIVQNTLYVVMVHYFKDKK